MNGHATFVEQDGKFVVTPNICQNCKWWSMQMAGKFGFHECQNPKINGTTRSWTDGVATNDNHPIATGPYFGCIHHQILG